MLVEVELPVALVTLNRPAQRNALDRSLLEDLERALVGLDADPQIDSIVLTGTDPAFCSGVDLKAARHGIVRQPADGHPLPAITTPLIAAVNGAAVTGGLELALACDFIIASERALFADTHARFGAVPFWGLTALLPAAVGIRRALQMSLTGAFVDADTALAWGLVNEVVAHESLLGRAREHAAAISATPPDARRALLAMYRAGVPAEQLRWERLFAEIWHAKLNESGHWRSQRPE